MTTKTQTHEQIEEFSNEVLKHINGPEAMDALARLEAFAKILATQRDRYRAEIERLEYTHVSP